MVKDAHRGHHPSIHQGVITRPCSNGLNLMSSILTLFCHKQSSEASSRCPHSWGPQHGTSRRIRERCDWTARWCIFFILLCGRVRSACDRGCCLSSRPLWDVIWPETLAWLGVQHDVMQADTLDVPPSPADALVDSGPPPHSLQLSRYHLGFLTGGSVGCESTTAIICRLCAGKASVVCYCTRFCFFVFSFLYIIASSLGSSKISCGIKDVKVWEISTLGELFICSWIMRGFQAAGAPTELRAKIGIFNV